MLRVGISYPSEYQGSDSKVLVTNHFNIFDFNVSCRMDKEALSRAHQKCNTDKGGHVVPPLPTLPFC